jgi:ribokinase
MMRLRRLPVPRADTYNEQERFAMSSKKPRIAVIGSFNMDLVVSMERLPQIGETLAGKDIHYIPGGKGANQAIGCARLGAEVVMVGAVGQDDFGKEIVRNMEENGISAGTIEKLEGVPTGTATVLHTDEDNCIIIVAGANGHCLPATIDKHEAQLAGADVMLLQLEVPMETVLYSLKKAKQAGITTVLNPAPAAPLTDEILSLADYLTPNETEFKQLTGQSFDNLEQLEALMQDWEQRYGLKLIVTRGEDGCVYLDRGDSKLRSIPAQKVQVVDTTGAGDAFNAGLSIGLASGWELDAAISFAGRTAAKSVTKFGAQAGMPYLADLQG